MKPKLPGTAETEGRAAGEPLSASRLVGFSDGVFAVVITLLVLNIQVPSEAISLHTLVAQQFPNYVIFIVTFAMVGIKWLNHHRLFALIRRVDTALNILNLLLLLGICAVPFTAAMVAKYMTTSDAAFASMIYGMVWTINGFLYTAILFYARKKGFTESSRGTQRMVTLYIIGPLGYLVAIGVSFWNIYAGIALYLAIVLLYIPPQRLPESRPD
jgi:uncharacterized membrane protein